MNGVGASFEQLNRIQRIALVVGLAATAVCGLGAYAQQEQFLHSYLLAYLFWVGIALGCTAVLMLHHLVGGGWGVILRRLLESGSRTIPLMALLVLPLLLGVRRLYEWAGHDAAGDEILKAKSAYLNVPFFVVRTVVYFAIWFLLAYYLNKWSREQDSTADPAVLRRLRALSGPGLILYALTVTFASVDWVMSLEPHWYSTVYGMLFMVGQVLATFSFAIAMAMMLADQEPISRVISKARMQDLGNLLLAFVMLWAYLAFSQFLIIWSGNLPEEITWYRHRLHGGWGLVAVMLLIFHFALPFLLLLSRDIKRKARMLGSVAVAVLFVRLLDLFWVIEPPMRPGGFSVHWLDVALPAAMGGIWISVFIAQLRKMPLLPVNDPHLLGEWKDA
jgi:hypothetical protein